MSLMDIEKWKYIKIEEFYHPKYQEYLRWFLDGTFVLSCLLYAFTAYAILFKSTKQMGTFKYTVFTQISFNMLYKDLIFLFNPIIHFPLPVFTFNSYFKFRSTSVIVFLGAAIFTIIAAAVAILFSVINRVLAGFDRKSTSTSSKLQFMFGIGAFLTLIMWGSTMAPVFILNPLIDPSWESLIATIPALCELQKILPNTFGVNPSQTGNLITIFIISVVSWTFIYTVTFITLNIIVLFQLKQIKKIVSKTTYSMHKMLHTALIIQTINLFLFAVIPICILVTVFLLQLSYGSWISNLSIPISSMHLIIDAPSLLYFIKPYQKFVLNVLKLVLKMVLKLIFQQKENPNIFKVDAFSMHQRKIENEKSRNLSIIENNN